VERDVNPIIEESFLDFFDKGANLVAVAAIAAGLDGNDLYFPAKGLE
jgi:hypothetical protein